MRPSAVATPRFWDALLGARTRRELEEFLDRPDVDARTLSGNLGHLRLMNRWLLWSAAVAREVEGVMRRRALSTASLLDVATGSADIPRAVARRAVAQGLRVRVVASDISAAVLAAAGDAGSTGSWLQLVQHEGTALPFADATFDIALCCLSAHHFDPPRLRRLLTELWRVARHAVIVSDLYRSRLNYLGARAMALVLRNPLTSHDGPVSVLRAYTPAELLALAASAGIEDGRVRTRLPARMTLVAEKGVSA